MNIKTTESWTPLISSATVNTDLDAEDYAVLYVLPWGQSIVISTGKTWK